MAFYIHCTYILVRKIWIKMNMRDHSLYIHISKKNMDQNEHEGPFIVHTLLVRKIWIKMNMRDHSTVHLRH